jgi:hypothetical protein
VFIEGTLSDKAPEVRNARAADRFRTFSAVLLAVEKHGRPANGVAALRALEYGAPTQWLETK